MPSKILSPHYLCLDREIACDEQAAWRALTDLHELRAWWGMPVADHVPDIGGGFELRFVGRDRVDRFEFTTWDENWRVGGVWTYNWLPGAIREMASIVATERGVRVTLEHTGFDSFGDDAKRIFSYHKIDLYSRLDRLRAWCEERVPANLSRMPLI